MELQVIDLYEENIFPKNRCQKYRLINLLIFGENSYQKNVFFYVE